MNPQEIFCPNIDFHARGQVGKGNIGVHSRVEKRYICHECQKTFTDRKGAIFYRLRTDAETATWAVAALRASTNGKSPRTQARAASMAFQGRSSSG